MSWDPAIATLKWSHEIDCAMWSPCSKFVAIASYVGVQIFDGATFKPLKALTSLLDTKFLCFSPKNHLLACNHSGELVIWDLQTGLQVSRISMDSVSMMDPKSTTYSECGMMFGVLSTDGEAGVISTYAMLSSAPTHHPVKGDVMDTVWTYGEYLQFATLGPGSITIWKVGFASKHPPTEAKLLTSPNDFDSSEEFIFLPTLFQLAFIHQDTVYVWDAQHSKLLLNYVDIESPTQMTFSPDGHFFACGAGPTPEIHLWEVSPTGYILNRKLLSGVGGDCTPLLSPNRQSIVVSSHKTLQSWYTIDSTTSSLAQAFQSEGNSILKFSPEGSLGVVTEVGNKTAKILDLKTSVTQWTIDAGMEIYGLGIAGSAITIVCGGNIITCNLPAEDHVLNGRENTNDSIQTTSFDFQECEGVYSALVSPNSDYIATIVGRNGDRHLDIYEVSTGKYLAGGKTKGYKHWFTPDGLGVLAYGVGTVVKWAIVRHHESGMAWLVPSRLTGDPPGGFPWNSSHGHQVMDDGWILSSGGKQLFWLPPYWQLDIEDRMWSGCFLAFLHWELPEVVILELPEE